MAQKVKDSSLGARLTTLTYRQGLRRPTLADDLGNGLRTLCDISPHDTPGDVLRKASAKFKQAIKELPGVGESTAEEVRILAEVAYNIARYPESREAILEDRRKWLADHEKPENWKDESGSKPYVAYQTGRSKLANHVIPELERIFLADWQKCFPGKPFPVDQMNANEPVEADPPLSLPGDAPRLKRPLGITKRRATMLAVTVVLVGAAITAMQVFRSPAPTPPPQNNALFATATSLSDVLLGHSTVFPSDRVNGVKTFANRLNAAVNGFGEDATTVFSDELNAGAYAMGGITAQVQLQNTSDDEVVVYNIRPVIRQRGDVVTGAAIRYPGQAGGIHTIWYELDRPNLVAKENDASGLPFFTTQRLGITKTDAQTLILQFKAANAAYDFNIAVDYEVNGQKFSRIVKQDKDGPDLLLRASGSVCDQSSGTSEHVTAPGVVQRGYQQVFRLGSYTDLAAYRVLPVDPSAFIAHGCD